MTFNSKSSGGFAFSSLSARKVRQAASTLAAAALAALACAGAPAQWRERAADFDEDRKPWQEIEAALPPYPKPESLVPFEAGGASPHRFFIDAQSLSVGEDEVVRYTLVIKTAGGATNVAYEGIRCETREQKYYALGQADGSWVRVRNPRWRRIEPQDVNRHHGVLHKDFLCSGRAPLGSVREVLQRLKYGSPTSG